MYCLIIFLFRTTILFLANIMFIRIPTLVRKSWKYEHYEDMVIYIDLFSYYKLELDIKNHLNNVFTSNYP